MAPSSIAMDSLRPAIPVSRFVRRSSEVVRIQVVKTSMIARHPWHEDRMHNMRKRSLIARHPWPGLLARRAHTDQEDVDER